MEIFYWSADDMPAPQNYGRHWPKRARLTMQVNGRIGQSMYYTVGYFRDYGQANQLAEVLTRYDAPQLETLISAAQEYGQWVERTRQDQGAGDEPPEPMRAERLCQNTARAGFHWRENWYFQREPDGSVHLRHFNGAETSVPDTDLTIPATEWASIVASVSKDGENGDTYRAALAFHGSAAP